MAERSYTRGRPPRAIEPSAYRGFHWVKWVARIEPLEHPDYGAPTSTVWSGFTPAGSGG